MLTEKTKESLINDINDAKTIDDLKIIIKQILKYLPTNEEISANLTIENLLK